MKYIDLNVQYIIVSQGFVLLPMRLCSRSKVSSLIFLAGQCSSLPVPSFGQLWFNSADVTQTQTNFDQNATVEYRCAEGYELYKISTGLSLDVTTQSITTCQAAGVWSLLGVSCRCKFECPGSVVIFHFQWT